MAANEAKNTGRIVVGTPLQTASQACSFGTTRAATQIPATTHKTPRQPAGKVALGPGETQEGLVMRRGLSGTMAVSHPGEEPLHAPLNSGAATPLRHGLAEECGATRTMSR